MVTAILVLIFVAGALTGAAVTLFAARRNQRTGRQEERDQAALYSLTWAERDQAYRGTR